MAKGIAGEFFERYAVQGLGSSDAHIRPRVAYSESGGRLFLMVDVREVGKPKKPIKEFCELMVTIMQMNMPLQNVGFYWHNTGLSRLVTGDWADPIYINAVDALVSASLLVLNVYPSYDSGGKRLDYAYTCRKQGQDRAVEHFK